MNRLTPRLTAVRPGHAFRAAALSVAVCLATFSTGCSGCSKGSPSGSSSSAQPVVLAAIPAPAGLMAELCVPKPDAAWAKVRATLGGPAAFLPGSFGGIAAAVLGLPLSLLGEFDGAIPVLGALVEEQGTVAGALGLHVKSGDRLLVALTKGEGARFSARQDAATSIMLLEPLGQAANAPDAGSGGTQSSVAIGILGNYLLVGRTALDLTVAGPYVVRTLPSAPVPSDDLAIEIPESALSGPIAAKARLLGEQVNAFISRGSAEGNVRDALGLVLGDKPFSETVQSLVGSVGEIRRARISVNVDEQAVHARMTATPKASKGSLADWIARVSPGDPQQLLDLPSDTSVALWSRGAAERRRAGAEPMAKGLSTLLGPSLAAADRDAIAAAFQALADSRGDWMTLGVAISPMGPSAYMRTAVADEAKLGKSVKDFFALSKLPSIQAKLKEKGFGVSTGKAAVEEIAAAVQRLRIERLDTKVVAAIVPRSDPLSLLPSSIDMLYTMGKDSLLLATGYQAKEALLRAHAAPGGENLGKNPVMRAAVGALGKDVGFVLAVDPIRLIATQSGQPPPEGAAPVVFAEGRDPAAGDSPGSLWWRLDVARPAIQELVKRRAVF
jgi:hypothetical protein